METETRYNGRMTAPARNNLLLAMALLGVVLSVVTLYGWRMYSLHHHATTIPRERPNIVLIIADDIAWNDYGFNHHPLLQTPNLDKLAASGVVFNNAYSPSSICRPSLASIITGLYPSQHRITGNMRVIGQFRSDHSWALPPFAKRMDELPTLPRALAPLGYRSLQTGKWWEEDYSTGGFSDGDKKPVGFWRHVVPINHIGRYTMQPLYDFIAAHQREPFFVWYAPQMPHTPWNPPEKFVAPYQSKVANADLRNYYGMVSWFDDTVGQLVQYLDEHNLRDNTVIIYLADNGINAQTDILQQGTPKGKDTAYEYGNRTTLIFNWPSHWKPAQREALVSSIDLYPTLLELLQQPMRHDIQSGAAYPGVSLLHTIADNAPLARTAVVGEIFPEIGEKLDNQRQQRWSRFNEDQHAWKLIDNIHGTTELYQLDSDPNENHNIAAQQPARVQRALQQLNEQLPE